MLSARPRLDPIVVTTPPLPRAFVLGNFVQACCWHVARLPQAGETLEAHHLQIEPGGKGLNVAVCLQRLGVAVDTLIGWRCWRAKAWRRRTCTGCPARRAGAPG